MKNLDGLNRRDVLVALSAFAVLGGLTAEASASDTSAVQMDRKQAAAGFPVLSQAQTFTFESLPVKASANGGASRAVAHGVLATGEFVEVHETTLPPGQMPHPPHKHPHSEFILIREGTLEFYAEGEKTQEAGPGGIHFNASNLTHGMKNMGVFA